MIFTPTTRFESLCRLPEYIYEYEVKYESIFIIYGDPAFNCTVVRVPLKHWNYFYANMQEISAMNGLCLYYKYIDIDQTITKQRCEGD